VPQVKVSFSIKVAVAHVRASDLIDHLLSVVSDVASEKVSGLFFGRSDVQKPCHSILFVSESYLAMHHVVAGANQRVSESVLLIVKDYF
jgi:hypothetical protein